MRAFGGNGDALGRLDGGGGGGAAAGSAGRSTASTTGTGAGTASAFCVSTTGGATTGDALTGATGAVGLVCGSGRCFAGTCGVGAGSGGGGAIRRALKGGSGFSSVLANHGIRFSQPNAVEKPSRTCKPREMANPSAKRRLSTGAGQKALSVLTRGPDQDGVGMAGQKRVSPRLSPDALRNTGV